MKLINILKIILLLILILPFKSFADFSSPGYIFSNLGGASASGQYSNTIQCLGENTVGTSSGGVYAAYSGFIRVWENMVPVEGFPDDNLPTEFKLHQNYPNPFNPGTTINFDIARASDVKVEIYNIRGEIVSNLVDEFKERGFYSVKWAAQGYASGIYFYKIEAGDFIEVKKMMIIK